MRKFLVVVLVLCGLVVVVDYGAAAAAEYTVSTRLREQLQLDDDPSVRITGFPFLTQAVRGRYRRIEASADGVDAGPLRDLRVEMTLSGVHAPLSLLLAARSRAQPNSQQQGSLRVDHVDGRVRLAASDIGRAISIPDLTIAEAAQERVTALSPPVAPDTTVVRLTGTVDLVFIERKVEALATARLVDGSIQIVPRSVRLAGQPAPTTGRDPGEHQLPPEVSQPLSTSFSTSLDPGTLPLNARATDLTVEGDSLVVSGEATDVVLDGSP